MKKKNGVERKTNRLKMELLCITRNIIVPQRFVKFIAINFFLLIYPAIVGASEPPRFPLNFFGSPTCGDCMEIKETILLPIVKEHSAKIDLRIYNVDTDSGFKIMTKLEEQFGVKTTASIELFFPDTFLIGDADIKKHARAMIEYRLAHPEKWMKTNAVVRQDSLSFAESLKKKFGEFSFLSIFAAGIVDGINPCAIATMIFLVSFLATRQRSRREILTIGLCFTAAVFFTYLLLGIGAFRAITALEHYRWLSKAIRWAAVGLALVVGIISFVDAFRYKKSRKTQDIALQLPKAVKIRIHKVISGNLSGTQLVMGAVVTGFLVTLLEAVCTGQVYLPTIILMTKHEGVKLTGWLYLVFYNVLFVLPLLIVMVLAYFGMKWDRLAKTTQKHLSLMKVLLGIVLIALSAFLAFAG
jgi:cytochrome c biogenesis protein CcdA